MNKESKILQPGDPEYHEALGSITDADMAIVKKGLEEGDKPITDIAWKKVSLREGYMEYAAIDLTETKVKIVFHFIKVSQKMMHEISTFFQQKICGVIVTVADIQDEVSVEAGQNPVWRSNWDIIFFNFNKFRAPGVMTLIANTVAKEFPV